MKEYINFMKARETEETLMKIRSDYMDAYNRNDFKGMRKAYLELKSKLEDENVLKHIGAGLAFNRQFLESMKEDIDSWRPSGYRSVNSGAYYMPF